MIYYAADQVEANGGYIKEMARDPLAGYGIKNLSILRRLTLVLTWALPRLRRSPMGRCIRRSTPIAMPQRRKPGCNASWPGW